MAGSEHNSALRRLSAAAGRSRQKRLVPKRPIIVCSRLGGGTDTTGHRRPPEAQSCREYKQPLPRRRPSAHLYLVLPPAP
jgi:hypothetical protein